MNKEITFCDHCGDHIPEGKGIVFTELPFDIASANEGESGVICRTCLAEFDHEICYCCAKPANKGESETGQCEKCGNVFHTACDEGWHTDKYVQLCSNCKPNF